MVPSTPQEKIAFYRSYHAAGLHHLSVNPAGQANYNLSCLSPVIEKFSIATPGSEDLDPMERYLQCLKDENQWSLFEMDGESVDKSVVNWDEELRGIAVPELLRPDSETRGVDVDMEYGEGEKRETEEVRRWGEM